MFEPGMVGWAIVDCGMIVSGICGCGSTARDFVGRGIVGRVEARPFAKFNIQNRMR